MTLWCQEAQQQCFWVILIMTSPFGPEKLSLGQVPHGFLIYPTLGPLAQSAVVFSGKYFNFIIDTFYRTLCQRAQSWVN
jgi:hypothetical protein